MVRVLDNRTARRIFLVKHGLVDAPSGVGKGADLSGVIHKLGFVQLDSVNTFARAHDLILWSRRQQYRPKALEDLLGRERAVFEHWTHDAATMPIAFFPMWRLRFQRSAQNLEKRWTKDRRGDFLKKTEEVMAHISDHGCCGSADIGKHENKSSGGWWDWNPSKTALEYLWHSGHLSVVRREGFRKIYDLTERVIPAEYLNTYVADQDTIDWHCREAIERLGFGTSGEIAAFWDTVKPQEAKDWCQTALASGDLIEIDVTCVDGQLRRSFAKPDVMDLSVGTASDRVRILSPFDPALRDRKRAERLFGFHYRIEIFVPEAKRQYGYYVFPVLQGDKLIGRIDMKADRKAKLLKVRALWPEVGVRLGSGRLARLETELRRAAGFSGCDEVQYADDWIRG